MFDFYKCLTKKKTNPFTLPYLIVGVDGPLAKVFIVINLSSPISYFEKLNPKALSTMVWTEI